MFRATDGSSIRSPRSTTKASRAASRYSPSICTSMPTNWNSARTLEFGANAGAYIAAFMRNIDWSAVKQRYDDAVKVAPPRPLEQKEFADVPSISVEEVREMMKSGTPVHN